MKYGTSFKKKLLIFFSDIVVKRKYVDVTIYPMVPTKHSSFCAFLRKSLENGLNIISERGKSYK